MYTYSKMKWRLLASIHQICLYKCILFWTISRLYIRFSINRYYIHWKIYKIQINVNISKKKKLYLWQFPPSPHTHTLIFSTFEKILWTSHLKSGEFVDTNLIQIGIHALNKGIGRVQQVDKGFLSQQFYIQIWEIWAHSVHFQYQIAHSYVLTERYMYM